MLLCCGAAACAQAIVLRRRRKDARRVVHSSLRPVLRFLGEKSRQKRRRCELPASRSIQIRSASGRIAIDVSPRRLCPDQQCTRGPATPLDPPHQRKGGAARPADARHYETVRRTPPQTPDLAPDGTCSRGRRHQQRVRRVEAHALAGVLVTSADACGTDRSSVE